MTIRDKSLTAASIAAKAGGDDFLAQTTPEDKLALIGREQAGGKLVAMCSDGTNDAPALAQADVGVAMNTGAQAAREAGNMVDLDSASAKLIEVVDLGKQLLMTRDALTTFSLANNVAIIPLVMNRASATALLTGRQTRVNMVSPAASSSKKPTVLMLRESGLNSVMAISRESDGRSWAEAAGKLRGFLRPTTSN